MRRAHIPITRSRVMVISLKVAILDSGYSTNLPLADLDRDDVLLAMRRRELMTPPSKPVKRIGFQTDPEGREIASSRHKRRGSSQ